MSAPVFHLGFLLLSSPRKGPARVRLPHGRSFVTGTDHFGVHQELVYRCADLAEWQTLSHETRENHLVWPGLELVEVATGARAPLTGSELLMRAADLATPAPESEPADTPPAADRGPEPQPAPESTPTETPPATDPAAEPQPAPVVATETPTETPAETPAPDVPTPAPGPSLLERLAHHFQTSEDPAKSQALAALANALGVGKDPLKEAILADTSGAWSITSNHYVKHLPKS